MQTFSTALYVHSGQETLLDVAKRIQQIRGMER